MSARSQPLDDVSLLFEQSPEANTKGALQMNTITHLGYMTLALKLAQRGRSTTSPNPMVGCVIVKNNQMVGLGFHERVGMAHAEINALQEAGNHALDATAYVTLEPCCHTGNTGPCTQAIIQAGIKKVYVASTDPNPMVYGKGITTLQSHGIEVEVGLCETQAKKLNEIYFHYITHQRPFVIAKWAMSLDGKTITHYKDNRKISGTESHYSSHELRNQVDAILIGSQTAIKDDPLLTVRLGQPQSEQPWRIVLCSRGELPFNLKIFTPPMLEKTIVVTTDAVNKNWYETAMQKQMQIWILPKDKNGHVHLPSLMNELGKRKITSILVEGGAKVHESFFNENIVNKIHVYLAPIIISSLEKKQPVINLSIDTHHYDFHFTADYTQSISVLGV